MKVTGFTVTASSKRSRNYSSEGNEITFVVEGEEMGTQEALIESIKLSWMAKEKILQDERCQGLISAAEFVETLNSMRESYRVTLKKLREVPGKLVIDIEEE